MYLAVANRLNAGGAIVVEQLDASGATLTSDPLGALSPVAVDKTDDKQPLTRSYSFTVQQRLPFRRHELDHRIACEAEALVRIAGQQFVDFRGCFGAGPNDAALLVCPGTRAKDGAAIVPGLEVGAMLRYHIAELFERLQKFTGDEEVFHGGV